MENKCKNCVNVGKRCNKCSNNYEDYFVPERLCNNCKNSTFPIMNPICLFCVDYKCQYEPKVNKDCIVPNKSCNNCKFGGDIDNTICNQCSNIEKECWTPINTTVEQVKPSNKKCITCDNYNKIGAGNECDNCDDNLNNWSPIVQTNECYYCKWRYLDGDLEPCVNCTDDKLNFVYHFIQTKK